MGNNGNTSNQTNPFYRAFQILLLIGIVLLLVYIIKLLLDYKPAPPPPPLPSPNPITPSATPTLTPTPTPTSPPPTSTFTPAPPVTSTVYVPVTGPIGTNLPPGFMVGPWHDDIPVCDRFDRKRPVNITGVTISGGIPPYEIVFTYFDTNQIIGRITATAEGRTDFEPPIVVRRGEYLHVTMIFGSSKWEDDLKYPWDYVQCDSKE